MGGTEETILIIDDEQIVTEILEELLIEKGFRVLTAWTGREGLSLLKKFPVDLVLLDKNLPDMEWTSVVQGVNSIDNRVPIVIITAYPSVESVVEAIDMGISNYLIKPFELEKVERTIERTISHRRLLRGFTERIEALEESTNRLRRFTGDLQSFTK